MPSASVPKSPAQKPAKGAKGMRAGGRATEAGMSFQGEVGAFLAVHMLAQMPVGQRFRLSHAEQIVGLRFESGKGLDDVIATLSGGGKASLQCKTSLNLLTTPTSDFAKTMGQVVEEIVRDPAISAEKTALVIALPMSVSAPVTKLEDACRRVAAGGLADLALGSAEEQGAFAKLKTVVGQAWTDQGTKGSPDYRKVASLLRVNRFERGETGAMRIEGAAMLGRTLYGGEAAGDAPFVTLIDIVRELIEAGHAIDRDQLLAELRRRGHVDVAAPRMGSDIERLRAHTVEQQERLLRSGQLALAGYRLARSCQADLQAAVNTGSLLVIGEPGAGKSGVLGSLGAHWDKVGPVVVLSVDRFAGIARSRDLADDLRLEHDVPEVLAAWPGAKPGLLIIDALDAARGGQAEAIFASLIASMAALAPRWRVVASVRTFDLLNGQRLCDLMPGAPPAPGYADPRADRMRHFLVPALNAAERETLGQDLPDLAPLLSSGQGGFATLLGNIFNLALAAKLIAGGALADSFAGITRQSDLIDRYEDQRIGGSTQTRSALIAAVTKMIELGKLALRVADLDHAGLEGLLKSGILEEAEERYQFSHHILFDHAAGRYFVQTDTGDELITQLKALGSKAFVLAPALRFALERY